MSEIVVGLVALVAGAFLCFAGRIAVRVILSIWGAFVGLALGGAAVSAITDSSPLSTILGWVVGILLAVLLAGLAYAFYALAVIIALGSIGYGLGAALALALGAGPQVAHIVAIAVAVLLAVTALVTDLPGALLVFLTAASGAGAIIAGLMLLVGVAVASDFSAGDLPSVIEQQSWWWMVGYVALTLGGILVQSRSRRTTAMRNNWEGAERHHP